METYGYNNPQNHPNNPNYRSEKKLAAGVLANWGIILSPAIGAILMSFSAVIVAINAMLLRVD